MLKIMITTLLIMASLQVLGSDYIIKVRDEVTSETTIFKVSSDNELISILNEIDLNDNLKVHFIKMGNQAVYAVSKIGGEGGTD